MSTIQSYLQALNETAGGKLGSLEGAEKATITPLSKKVVDGIEEPVEVSAYTGVEDTKTSEEGVKYNHMSKNNVFEQLYKRAINEDFDEDPAGGATGGFGDDAGDMGGDSDMEFGGDEGQEMDADPSHVGKVKEVVELLQQALDILTSFEGEEEEEYEEYEDSEGDDEGGFGGDEDYGDEEPVTEEENQQFGAAKTIGHALVSREKFTKGQDKKSNMVVKGAVPGVGTKAKVPTSGKRDGKLSNFSDAGGKKMQGKGNMKVAGRAANVGKFAFEN